ncbi:hypothetical protein AAVH_06049 [Aphelenchoides avenae]|nr:hypothetical protein AAVH_06049 [Aphelenchus avenae]
MAGSLRLTFREKVAILADLFHFNHDIIRIGTFKQPNPKNGKDVEGMAGTILTPLGDVVKFYAVEHKNSAMWHFEEGPTTLLTLLKCEVGTRPLGDCILLQTHHVISRCCSYYKLKPPHELAVIEPTSAQKYAAMQDGLQEVASAQGSPCDCEVSRLDGQIKETNLLLRELCETIRTEVSNPNTF